MKNHTVASRYARALLSLGLADGKYVVYGQELRQLTEALDQTGETARALTSPAFSREIKKKMLDEILNKASLSPLVGNFINLLQDKGRLADLDAIAETYTALANAEEGIVTATVTSALPLDNAEIASITEALNNFSGKKVVLKVKEDPSVIGGIKAQLGDLVIDGTVRTQLARLAGRLDSL